MVKVAGQHFTLKRCLFFKRFEDTELELEPLPEMKLVATPDGLPNEVFGDVAMVVEFISCYQGLLMPNKDFGVSSGILYFMIFQMVIIFQLQQN